MQVHTDIHHLPGLEKAVVTIGTFDGVHLGHQKILSLLKSEAEKVGGESVIITFHPHPRKIVHSGSSPLQLINTIEERIELIAAKGIHRLVIVPFTEEFSRLTPREYVEDFLTSKFHPHTIIIGYDHQFGRGREGDFTLLEEYSSKHCFTLKEIPQQVINHNAVSSTLIRNFLLKGDISAANSLLGYEFFFEGRVVQGDQRGRSIGFPTANLKLENQEKILPGTGVYAITALVMDGLHTDRIYKGMMNIGFRPTVDGSLKTTEAHLFDFSGDIYGNLVRVVVMEFLREEKKFNNLDELKDQLAIDRIRAIKALEHVRNS